MTTAPLPPELESLDFEPSDSVVCECPACLLHVGEPCVDPAVWKTSLHCIHGCNSPDLTPDGDAVRLLCDPCMRAHKGRAIELSNRAQVVFRITGGILVCRTCQRPLLDVDAFLKVEEFSGL